MAEDRNQTIKQLLDAWEAAKAQMASLRSRVDELTELAQLKLQSSFLDREKDQAFRDLGEAVWGQVRRGKLQLPPAVAEAVKAVEKVEKRLESQTNEINALLAEGESAAENLKSSKALAGKSKKR